MVWNLEFIWLLEIGYWLLTPGFSPVRALIAGKLLISCGLIFTGICDNIEK
jgi:hypothetical protein